MEGYRPCSGVWHRERSNEGTEASAPTGQTTAVEAERRPAVSVRFRRASPAVGTTVMAVGVMPVGHRATLAMQRIRLRMTPLPILGQHVAMRSAAAVEHSPLHPARARIGGRRTPEVGG